MPRVGKGKKLPSGLIPAPIFILLLFFFGGCLAKVLRNRACYLGAFYPSAAAEKLKIRKQSPVCAVPFLSIYLFIGISAITLEGTGRFLSESTVSYFLRVCFHPRFAAPLQGCEAARSWQRPAAALERSRCGFLRQGEAKFVPQPITPFLELPQSCCCQRCCL